MITISQLTHRLSEMSENRNLSDSDREILKEAYQIISHNFHGSEPTDSAIMGYGLKNGPMVRTTVQQGIPDRPYLPNPCMYR